MEEHQSDVQSSPLVRGRVSVKNVDKIVCKWEVLEIIRTVTIHQTESGGLPLAVQRHYLQIDGQPLKKVRSPTFRHTESSEWCMELSEQNGDTYLQFRLLSSQRDQSTKARVSACLLSEDEEKFSVYSKEYVVLRAPQASVKKKLHISNHNAYKLIGEVSVPAAVAFSSAQGERQARRLGDDLGALLRSSDLADVLLCAGEREFSAHRAVLSARSPVFAAMLHHDTREARTGRVVVSDVDADTMRSFLHHVYTGRAPADARVDERLLAAADKYGVQDLKELCELEMARGLTADNAVAAGLAALANSCSLLRVTAVAFIKSNFAEVMGTDGWADAVKHHPDAVIELSRLIAVKHING